MTRPLDVRLSDHARERAQQMGIPTKHVKRTVREPQLRYRQGDRPEGEVVACNDKIAVPYVMRDDVAVVLTVLPRGGAEYVR